MAKIKKKKVSSKKIAKKAKVASNTKQKSNVVLISAIVGVIFLGVVLAMLFSRGQLAGKAFFMTRQPTTISIADSGVSSGAFEPKFEVVKPSIDSSEVSFETFEQGMEIPPAPSNDTSYTNNYTNNNSEKDAVGSCPSTCESDADCYTNLACGSNTICEPVEAYGGMKVCITPCIASSKLYCGHPDGDKPNVIFNETINDKCNVELKEEYDCSRFNQTCISSGSYAYCG